MGVFAKFLVFTILNFYRLMPCNIIIAYVFQDHYDWSTFFPHFFLWSIILKHTSTVDNRHGQAFKITFRY